MLPKVPITVSWSGLVPYLIAAAGSDAGRPCLMSSSVMDAMLPAAISTTRVPSTCANCRQWSGSSSLSLVLPVVTTQVRDMPR